jgi:hypothetical protein
LPGSYQGYTHKTKSLYSSVADPDDFNPDPDPSNLPDSAVCPMGDRFLSVNGI